MTSWWAYSPGERRQPELQLLVETCVEDQAGKSTADEVLQRARPQIMILKLHSDAEGPKGKQVEEEMYGGEVEDVDTAPAWTELEAQLLAKPLAPESRQLVDNALRLSVRDWGNGSAVCDLSLSLPPSLRWYTFTLRPRVARAGGLGALFC